VLRQRLKVQTTIRGLSLNTLSVSPPVHATADIDSIRLLVWDTRNLLERIVDISSLFGSLVKGYHISKPEGHQECLTLQRGRITISILNEAQ
jgi:hypothetical protein